MNATIATITKISTELGYAPTVDLEEGLRILTNVVGCSHAGLEIGMPLEVTFEAITDEVTLPSFKPVG